MSAKIREIVLASGSRARREMLAAAGVHFTVQAADVDEPALRHELMFHHIGTDPGRPGHFSHGDQPWQQETVNPRYIALVLAQAKAKNVSALRPGALVIGADQILALDSEVLSKAESIEAARDALKRLRGRMHELHSAVVFAEDGNVSFTHVGTARLTMRDFSDAFLDDYLKRAADRVTQTVGAYELEGLGIQLFEEIEGDYFTVLGLPLLPTLAELRARGIILT